jgi:UDP-GlcNAc:undecaprenyl-phosphate GlcNAc-1-phosphate transferase
VISLLIGLRARAIGRWLKVIDYPGGHHKTHDSPVPLVGGIAVALPVLTYCFLSLWKYPDILINAVLLIALGGGFLMGFLDDRRPLRPLFKLLLETALVFASLSVLPTLVVEQFDFSFLGEPVPLAPFAIAFSVLVVVGMMNAINMLDGMNGLASGLCLIWTLFLLIYAPPEIFSLLVLLSLCLFVSLVFNLAGKLFLGNSGSYALGLTIALLTIYTYNKAAVRLPADVVVVWFIVPVLDCLRVMLMRALHHRSPMSADTDHLHHRLQRWLPKRWVVISIWALVTIPGLAAMVVPSWTLAAVLTATGVYAGLIVLSSDRSTARKRRVGTISLD